MPLFPSQFFSLHSKNQTQPLPLPLLLLSPLLLPPSPPAYNSPSSSSFKFLFFLFLASSLPGLPHFIFFCRFISLYFFLHCLSFSLCIYLCMYKCVFVYVGMYCLCFMHIYTNLTICYLSTSFLQHTILSTYSSSAVIPYCFRLLLLPVMEDK